MDPKAAYPALMAPGASASTPLRCPAASPWPAVDDHLVEPEVSRDEVVRGQRMLTMGANAEHGDPHCNLDYLVRGNVAPGYVASTDLLSRFGLGSNFASDTCVRKVGTDPETGRRYLEELAFEVVNEQPMTGPKGVTAQAEDMVARGVRRVIAAFVKTGEVKEWRGGWVGLALDSLIEDPVLVRPILARAILDAALADDEVARALDAKGNRVIRQIRQQERKEGQKEGVDLGRVAQARDILLALLRARDLVATEEVRARVLACADLEELTRWTIRAASATTLHDVFGGVSRGPG